MGCGKNTTSMRLSKQGSKTGMLTFVDGVTRVSTHVAVHARYGKLTFVLVEKASHLRPVGQKTDGSDAEQNGGDPLQSQRFRINNVQVRNVHF